MLKHIKTWFIRLSERVKRRSFETWRLKEQNRILEQGVVGNEWKLKALDRITNHRYGLWFPLSLPDDEYAVLACESALENPYISNKAKGEALEYLELMGWKKCEEYGNVVYRHI